MNPRVWIAACASLCLLVAGSAHAAGKSVEQASAGEKKEAGDLYSAAMAQFEKDDFDSALKGFRESYAIVRSPNSHFMIARSLARLGRNVEAYDELEAVIAEAAALGDRYADTATAARAKEDEVRPRIGLVTVKLGAAPKGTRVLEGDETLDPARVGKPIAVLPGETTFTAVTPDGRRFPKSVKVSPGGSAEVELAVEEHAQPQEPPTYAERSRHLPYLLELEGHVVGEALQPPGNASRGAGVGGRVSIELLHAGFVPGLNDGLELGAGLDWIATSTNPHFWVPAAVDWSVWLAPEFSVLVEPGAALLLGDGTHVYPVFALGARYRIWKSLHVVGKLGVPTATLGVSFLE